MPSKHALLSPSASHRWLNCTPSARLESEVPNEGSDYTREGTLAHAFCAKGLKAYLGQTYKDEDIEIEELFSDYYTDDMDDYVATYIEIVEEKLAKAKKTTSDAKLIVERQLDFSEWIPGSFGTADAIIIADGTMEVIDFKYGKGVEVSAMKNTQMMIYALGAISAYEDEYHIDNVRMTIVQPRISNLSEYESTVADLKKWATDVLAKKAKQAMKGEGEQKAGDWCRFCRVKNQCRAMMDKSLEVFNDYKDTELIKPDELAEKVLPFLDTMKNWLDGVAEFALKQAMDGVVIKGYKVVEGRSLRKITDQAKAAEVLEKNGFTEIYKPKELKTLGDLEKMVGKKDFTPLMGDLLIKPQGKPTLVPESDKRPALNAAKDDFKEF